jgi:hypothetical protein
MSVPDVLENPLTAMSTTLAHLLSEEARVRRIPFVEKQDAHIDDISAIVLIIEKNTKHRSSRFTEAYKTRSTMDRLLEECSSSDHETEKDAK